MSQGSEGLLSSYGSGADFISQEDAVGEGAGLRVVAGTLGGPAAQQPGEAPSEHGQPADAERGENTIISGGWEELSTRAIPEE